MQCFEMRRELFAVLGKHDRPYRGSQHPHAVLLENSSLLKNYAAIERRLPAEREKHAVRFFFRDDLFHKIIIHR